MTGRLGRYELHDVLGTGGFATVYRATDPSLEAIVAVKVLADNWSRNPEVRRRFRAEAVLLRRVQASGSVQGLVEVHDIDEDDWGRPYYVMSYADQGTLADRASTRAWSAPDVVPVIDALAETVGALHDNEIVHRDLKPSNILLRSDGRALTGGPGILVARHERLLISDLGLAKDLRRETTSMSFGGGTHRYLAPEQLDLRATVDHRVDVYAATAIISVLLTGWEHPPMAPGLEPAIGPTLGRALERGLSSDPHERFESMWRWRQCLLGAIDEETTTPSVPPERARSPLAGIGPLVSHEAGHSTTRGSIWRGRRAALVLTGLVAMMALVWLTVHLVGDDGIIGPDEVVVGETARFRAAARLGQPVLWIGPNGEQVRQRDLEVRAIAPGRLRIELLAGGDRTSRTIQAVPSPLGPRIDGPTEGRVSQSVVLRSSSPGNGRSHYWIDPSGDRVENDELEFTPTAPGTWSVTLIAVGNDGIERGARHDVEVTS